MRLMASDCIRSECLTVIIAAGGGTEEDQPRKRGNKQREGVQGTLRDDEMDLLECSFLSFFPFFRVSLCEEVSDC